MNQQQHNSDKSGEFHQLVIAPGGEGDLFMDRFLRISGHYLATAPLHSGTGADLAKAAALGVKERTH